LPRLRLRLRALLDETLEELDLSFFFFLDFFFFFFFLLLLELELLLLEDGLLLEDLRSSSSSFSFCRPGGSGLPFSSVAVHCLMAREPA